VSQTVEIEGEIFSSGPSLEEILAADETDLDASEIDPADDDPESWRYYADVMDEKTIAYLFGYARRHPDDEFIQGRIESLRQTNEAYKKRHGKNIPGYDEKYFAAAD
jgi:hypothetical protein